MKRHLKRQATPKNWPVPRKGTTFIVTPNSKGLPVLILLRDLLKIAKDRSEVKKAIHKKDVIVSGKVVNHEKKSLELFDTLTIIPSKEHYRVVLSDKGKYDLEKIDEKGSKIKISKIIGKKTLKNKKVQINLADGRNYLFDSKCAVNDSAVIDLEKVKVAKIIPMKEKSPALVIGGKHAGMKGKITKILEESKMAEIESGDKNFRVLIKQLMVLE